MSNAQKRERCEDLIAGQMAATMETLQAIWDQTVAGGAEYADEEGGETNLYEYGLDFSYVYPETFGEDQAEGYWRYQLSWGGPSDEIRFYVSPGGHAPYKIRYHYMDWFDGASLDADNDLTRDLWEWFECVWGGYEYDE